MKNNITILIISILVSITSCSDFLDTAPYDQLSPATFWQTEKDANDFVTACYNGWSDGYNILYWDCTSDIGYNFHPHEGYQSIGNGTLSTASTGNGYFSYTTIRRCNTFLDKAKEITFQSAVDKKDLFAQVRTIRAYRYFLMNFWYGGVPITKELYETAEEAQIPRDSEAEVKKYIYDELDAAIPDLKKSPSATGRIAQGTALAIKMRAALYWGDYQLALDAAEAIKTLGIYELHHDYSELFTLKGKTSKEIIYATQYVENIAGFWLIGAMYNNGDGGWSSIVPTQNLVDMYEMNDGKTKDEAGSIYNPVHPFDNREPRMEMTIAYPGIDWTFKEKTRIFNTLDKTIEGKDNPDFPTGADNASKTGLIWLKYTYPTSQYNDEWNTSTCPILFRYAEVLLTIAEAKVELNQDLSGAIDALDEIRNRVGHTAVNREIYSTQDKLRELVRRERCIELAGEGLRRADIVRWKDNSGKMVAETVLNETLTRITGTIDYTENDPKKRASVSTVEKPVIETRVFKPHHRYLPISQTQLDRNKQLTPTLGYQ